MKCPVCNTEIDQTELTCPFCNHLLIEKEDNPVSLSGLSEAETFKKKVKRIFESLTDKMSENDFVFLRENSIQNHKKKEIISSLPFMFWYPYLKKNQSKSTLFYADQSFLLTVLFGIISSVLGSLVLFPFSKTVYKEIQGITYYKSVSYIPTVILVSILILFFLWLVLCFINTYCACKGRHLNILFTKKIRFFYSG